MRDNCSVVLHRAVGEPGYFPAGVWLKAFEEDGFLWIISCKDETTIKRIARGNVKERKNDTPVTT